MTVRRDPHVEFDPVVVCSVVGDRMDIMLRGRAVAAAPVEAVGLLLGDQPVARVTFGLPEMDGSVRPADDPTLRHYAVTFIVTRGVVELSELMELTSAITVGGLPPRKEALVLRIEPPAGEIDPSQPGLPSVTIEKGRVLPQAGHAGILPAVVLQIERAELDDDGRITLGGWAVSLQPVIAIQVFIGDERLGAAQIGLSREDVHAAFPPYPNAAQAGFVFTGAVSPGHLPADHMRVQVIALNGIAQDCAVRLTALGGRAERTELTEDAAEPSASGSIDPEAPGGVSEDLLRLHCDEATLFANGDLVVMGWCVAQVPPVRIMVELAGAALGDAETGRERPDVGTIYPEMPNAPLSGFRLRAETDIALDEGTPVALTAEDGLGRRQRVVRPLAIHASPGAARANEPGEPGEPGPGRIKFNLDAPALSKDEAKEVVAGHLMIEGWVVAVAAIESIDVMIDGDRLGSAYYGLARQDVAAALPDWPNALRSGFAFHCPPRALKNGSHVITLDCRLAGGGVHSESFRIAVNKPVDADSGGAVRRRISRVEAGMYARVLRSLGWDRRFVVALRDSRPGDEPEDAVLRLRLTLGALRGQAVCRWALQLGGEAGPARRLLATEFADLAPLVLDEDPSAEDLLLPLSPGDELGCDALAELALSFAMDGADLAYADESRTGPDGGAREPFFKPGWSPDLLLASDYIGRPWCADADVLARAGLDGADALTLDNHDLLLRCTERAHAIRHVPALLCRSAEAAPVSGEPGAAVRAAAERRGFNAVATPGRAAGAWRLTSRAAASGIVSVVIPTCGAGGHIRTCIPAVRAHAGAREIEIIVIDNIPAELAELKAWVAESADVVVDMPEAFNWSRFNNRAVEAARGDYLLFLNDDVQATADGWLEAMIEAARRPGVGAVGAQLLYPDGKVQHAGMFLSKLGQARHAFRFLGGDDPGPFGLALTERNVVSVTGACMLVPRDAFEALGGFDEAHGVINNDLDFCLRLGASGRRIVYTPHASLIHHELASRAALGEDFDASRFEAAWRHRFVAGDPYHGPGLSKHHDDYRPEDEQVSVVHGGHPLFAREDVRRILAVKVDHIGDFITAMPALRRLRKLFPHARISVLASGAAKSIAHLEHSIDEVIEFEFFHIKSSMGRKELTAEELSALRADMAPRRFDLAIDLRKHLDTRELLRWTGATWLAGFDHLGQFPWLDISLEWEGDRGLHAKRYHIADDLLHLVDAVGTACETDRGGMLPARIAAAAASLRLPDAIEQLFRAPVACIHAGAGNALKQWPPEYFATLADLLLRRGISLLFVGGPDEADVTQDIIDRVQALDEASRGALIGSLVGVLSLRDLPAAISRCALYVGNDSGPKHVAAAVGVPTVGIHSGTVDPHEWAPVGANAVAIHRAMSCSPCYILSADRCPRALGCLTGIEPMAVMRACERLLAQAEVRAGPHAAEPPRRAEFDEEDEPTGASLADHKPAKRRPWLLLGRKPD